MKCHHYWPSEGSRLYGVILVELIEEASFGDYISRKFKLTHTEVCQYCHKKRWRVSHTQFVFETAELLYFIYISPACIPLSVLWLGTTLSISVCLSVCLSVWVSGCRTVCLVCPSACLNICLFFPVLGVSLLGLFKA